MDSALVRDWLPYFLVFCRIGAFMVTAPVLSLPVVPRRVRAGFALLTAVIVGSTGVTGADLAVGAEMWPLYVAKEVLIGAALGYLSALVVLGAQAAGSLLSFQVGFSFGQYVNPAAPFTGGQLESLLNLTAGLVLFASGAHLLLLRALLESFVLFPVQTLGPGMPVGMLDLIAGSTLLALRIAFPMLAAFIVAEAALGFIARVVPQLNALVLAVPAKVMLLFFVAIAVLPASAATLAAAFEATARYMLRLAQALGGA